MFTTVSLHLSFLITLFNHLGVEDTNCWSFASGIFCLIQDSCLTVCGHHCLFMMGHICLHVSDAFTQMQVTRAVCTDARPPITGQMFAFAPVSDESLDDPFRLWN